MSTTCPKCRTSMRCWAKDWRRETEPAVKTTCLNMAKLFRDGGYDWHLLPTTKCKPYTLKALGQPVK